MPTRLFPSALDATCTGSRLALWLLLPVLAMKTLIGVNFSGLNPFVDVAQVLETVDGVPLGSFSPAAAKAVLAASAAWGVALLALCLMCWLVVLRYRSGLPLATLLLLFEQAGRAGAGAWSALAGVLDGPPLPPAGALINLGMLLLLAAALALSLRGAAGAIAPAEAAR